MSEKNFSITLSGNDNDDVRNIKIDGVGTYFSLHKEDNGNYSVHSAKPIKAILKKVSMTSFNAMMEKLKETYPESEVTFNPNSVEEDKAKFEKRYLGDKQEKTENNLDKVQKSNGLRGTYTDVLSPDKPKIDLLPALYNLLDYAGSKGEYEFYVNGKYVGEDKYEKIFDGKRFDPSIEVQYIPSNLGKRLNTNHNRESIPAELFEKLYGAERDHIYRGFIERDDYIRMFMTSSRAFHRDLANLYPTSEYTNISFGKEADGVIAGIRDSLNNSWNSPDSKDIIESNTRIKEAILNLKNINEKNLIASPSSEATTEDNKETYKALKEFVNRWEVVTDLMFGEYILLAGADLDKEVVDMAKNNVNTRGAHSYHLKT